MYVIPLYTLYEKTEAGAPHGICFGCPDAVDFFSDGFGSEVVSFAKLSCPDLVKSACFAIVLCHVLGQRKFLKTFPKFG